MNLFRKKNITENQGSTLVPCLTAFDLILMGIGAIIGAGIFVITGIVAATQTGPAIILSYFIAGCACAFSALAYAELSALVGGCGSAYTYAYAGFGELIAWIVGWDLISEYAISVSAVSVGWSGYLHDGLNAISIDVPSYLWHEHSKTGTFNALSFGIILLLTLLLSFGVKTSKRINNVMVAVKLCVIVLFIAVASMHINTNNWFPFMPYGWGGVAEGASLIFFAYIGFDAVSTAAEETINPMRDLPIGILGSLLFCTVLYIIIAGLLTAIVPYPSLNVASPISHAMLQLGHSLVASLIGVGAIAGLTTVMLVLFYALTRLIFALARDGLLPAYFIQSGQSKIPVRIIVVCGIIMAILAGWVPMNELAELVNIGTLFAFTIVCGGVIVLRYRHPELPRPFKTPWMPVIPALGILCCLYLIIHLPWITMLRFIIWMVIGLIYYFFYGRYRSLLQETK